jgi:polyphosphate kinase
MNIVATTSETPPLQTPTAFPPEYFQNREMSLLAFNRRVLWQARNPRTPLLERLRFLCIVSSNLDEFFEIREAGIKEQLKLNSVAITTDGKTAREVYRLVGDETHAIVKEQYALLNDEILPQLAAEGIRFLKRADWNVAQREWIRRLLFPRSDAGHHPDRT